MTNKILWKLEWRMASRMASGWIACAVIVVTLLGAAWLSQKWMRVQAQLQEMARADEVKRLAEQQERINKELETLKAKGEPLTPVTFSSRHATSVGHYQAKRYAMLPTAPLAVLAIGDTDTQPSQFLVSVDPKQFSGESDLHQPLWLRAGRFDPSFVVAVIFPLLLIAALGAPLSSDRGGTLNLLATQGAPLMRVARIRILVRGLPITFITLLTLAVIVGVKHGAAALVSVRFMWLLLALLLYATFWMALVALVDAISQNVGTTIIRLIAVWAALVVVIPAMTHATATIIHPVTSRALIEETLREAQQEVWDMPREAILTEARKQYPDINPGASESLEEFMMVQMQRVTMEDQRVQPLLRQHEAQQQAQASFVRGTRFLSPVQMLRHALEESAGAGTGRRASFLTQVNGFFHTWQNFFVPRIFHRIPVDDMAATPVFHFQEESAAQAVQHTLADVACLLVVTIACAVFAKRQYRLASLV
jgi:ABC-2 type transport system permease protein